jgi:hypothetical protein
MSWVITGSEKTPVDPQFGSVSLLLHGDGTNGSTTITDSSRFANTVTAVGNAQISTAQSKFSGASIAFDGTGDYLIPTASNIVDFGTADFTIEGWFYLNALGSNRCFIDGRSAGINNQVLCQVTTDNRIKFGAIVSGSVSYFVESTSTFSANTWIHIAISRQSTTLRLFFNGELQSNVSNSTNFTSGTNRPTIGATGFSPGDQPWNGYMDEIRITKGIARYTANFTPPTAQFPDI